MPNKKMTRTLCLMLALLAMLIGIASAQPHMVRAAPAVLTSITISPQNPTMYVGQSKTFTAQGYDQNGSPVPIPSPAWYAGNGTITFPDTGNMTQATFTATQAGKGYVQCFSGPLDVQGSTDITILQPGELDHIIMTPADITLHPGQQQQFSATGYDAGGNQVPITPNWTTTGGFITPSGGLYTATAVGDFTVTASVEGSPVTGTASVHVTLAKLYLPLILW